MKGVLEEGLEEGLEAGGGERKGVARDSPAYEIEFIVEKWRCKGVSEGVHEGNIS